MSIVDLPDNREPLSSATFRCRVPGAEDVGVGLGWNTGAVVLNEQPIREVSDRYGYLIAPVFDGTEQWRAEYPQTRVDSSPAIHEDTIDVGVGGAVAALFTSDGTEKWRFSAGKEGVFVTGSRR